MVNINLSRLAQAPVPPELALVEQRVLSCIAAEGSPSAGGGFTTARYVAATFALALGIAAGAFQSDEAYAKRAPLSPLDSASAFAPSSLLLGSQ